MTSTTDEIRILKARVDALLAELATRQTTIPALPGTIDGQAVTWRPWQQPPTPITHVDVSCPQCAHPGPPMLALGLAGTPGVIRYQASRCQACQETRVYRREHARYGPPRVHLEQVAYIPPRTAPTRSAHM